MQKAIKAVQAGQYLRPMQRRLLPSKEIRVHSRIILTRYKGCTNARCILSRSNGHEEFKNLNPFSVQKAHKAVRAGQYLRSLRSSIEPTLEIHVHSRLFLARYKCCTNARCILSRRYGHEEFKNIKTFFGAKGEQSCTGRGISPFSASPYSAVNANSRAFATNLSLVQRLH